MSEIAVLKITLRDVDPAVWRRVEFPTSLTFAKLHGTIQAVFGWDNDHLHEFRVGEDAIGIKDAEAPGVKDGIRVKVMSALQRGVRRFTYHYDFGDDWECDIEVEEIRQTKNPVLLPCCVGGARNGPPEDCGGPYQYSDDAKKLRRPGKRRGEKLQWYDPEFDPDHFNVDEANEDILRRIDFLSAW